MFFMIMVMMMFPQYVAADSPEPVANSGTFVAMPATVESPGWKESFMTITWALFQLSRSKKNPLPKSRQKAQQN